MYTVDLFGLVALVCAVTVVYLFGPLTGAARTTRPAAPACFGCFWIAFSTVITGLFMGMGAWSVYRNATASTWPTVAGTVIESRVDSRQSTSKGRTTTTYRPYVRYSYTAGGAPRVAERFYPSGSAANGDRSYFDAEQRLQAVLRYAPLRVRVNPSDPDDTALELERDSGAVSFVIGFGFFLLFVAAIGRGMFSGGMPQGKAAIQDIPSWFTRGIGLGVVLIVLGFSGILRVYGLLSGTVWWCLCLLGVAGIVVFDTRRRGRL